MPLAPVIVTRWRTQPLLTADNMTCKETMRLMCEYLERKLSSTVVRDIRCHLDHCRDCRVVLDAARTTLEAYFGEPPTPLPRAERHVA